MSTLNTFYFKVLLLNANTFSLSSSVLSMWVDKQIYSQYKYKNNNNNQHNTRIF